MSDKSAAGSGSEKEEEFDEAYEVEEIRDKCRGDDGEYLYYVKWKGWESDTNTWEPVEHLEDCKEKLEEFEAKWKIRQDRKKERRNEERERKRQQRRERELKAAARYRMDSDSDGGGYDRGSKEHKKDKRKPMSSSDSESDEEKKKEKQKRRQEEKERRRAEKEKRREEEKKRQPRYFRDIKPEKILGATTDLGELMFYIKWEDNKAEPGLVKAKECYTKIPMMCLKWYERNLVWNKPPVKAEVKTDSKPEVKPEEDTEEKKEPNQEETKAEEKEDEIDDALPMPVPAE